MRRSRRTLRLALLGALAFGVAARGQTAGGEQQARPLQSPLSFTNDLSAAQAQPEMLAPAAPDNYLIGPDDLLAVFVLDVPGLSGQSRVDTSGAIRLPLLPRALPVAGLDSSQVAELISTRLEAAGLARSPVVRVIVREVKSHPVVVSGAVKDPVVLQAVRPMTLLEVLARAGGTTIESGTDVIVTRPAAGGAAVEHFTLSAVLDGSATSAPLTGGETVRVLPQRKVYAVGALANPGGFPVVAGEPLSALKVLSLAGGFSSTSPADKGHAEIIRDSSGSQPTIIPLDLSRVLKHQAEDPGLRAGDILFVPPNTRRKLLNTAVADAAQALVIFFGYHLRGF